MPLTEDQILTFVSIGDMSGGNLLSRRDYLTQHAECWQELLHSGLSMYLCANGETLAADKAVLRLMAYSASLNARQHLEESLLDHFQLRNIQRENVFQPRVEDRFEKLRQEMRRRRENTPRSA
ncbi:MAG: hypothetical protein CVV27_16765 [Candidatus Melainabacteria bacterium HGW-Melainabacteria-1]|nr:MAG: hypothetical protein CVV27_16765 [Candidatus Melainabacteria bacterium HGW-Melainabacteria-1]